MSFIKFLKENEGTGSGDQIPGLPIGKELFGQSFISVGEFNPKAKQIIADELKGRLGVFVYGWRNTLDRFGGITNTSYFMYLDLGHYGHGFSDKASANNLIKTRKSNSKAGGKKATQITYKVIRVDQFAQEAQKIREAEPIVWRYFNDFNYKIVYA